MCVYVCGECGEGKAWEKGVGAYLLVFLGSWEIEANGGLMPFLNFWVSVHNILPPLTFLAQLCFFWLGCLLNYVMEAEGKYMVGKDVIWKVLFQ